MKSNQKNVKVTWNLRDPFLDGMPYKKLHVKTKKY